VLLDTILIKEAEIKLHETIKNDQNREFREIAETELEKLQYKLQIIL
jgi:hypothetical protein